MAESYEQIVIYCSYYVHASTSCYKAININICDRILETYHLDTNEIIRISDFFCGTESYVIILVIEGIPSIHSHNIICLELHI